MANTLKKYFIFAKSGMQMTMAYRGTIMLWFFGGAVNAAVTCLLWWAIYKFSPENAIAGYTLAQMMMYNILVAVVNEMTFSDTMSSIGDDVRQGVIGMRLMKPISYRAQLGFSTIGSFAARLLLLGIPMIVVGSLIGVFGFGLEGLEWYNVLLFVPAMFLATMLNDSLGFLFGQLAFRTHAMFGVNSIMNVIVGFLSGMLVPIALFPAWAQTALAFTPFPSMMSMPIRLFLGMMDPQEVLTAFGISLLWLLVINVLGQLFYKSSVRRVVVFGG